MKNQFIGHVSIRQSSVLAEETNHFPAMTGNVVMLKILLPLLTQYCYNALSLDGIPASYFVPGDDVVAMRVIPAAAMDIDDISVELVNDVFHISAPNLRCGIIPKVTLYNDPVSDSYLQILI